MSSTKSNWQKTRKFLNDIHLWLGLISGIIVFVVCLSGTIYVFNTELREMAAPNLYKVQASDKKLEIEELAHIVKQESKGKVSAVKIPYDAQRSYAFTVRKKEENESKRKEVNPKSANHTHKQKPEHKASTVEPRNGGGRGRGNQFMVNPYTGEVLGDLQGTKTTTAEFMQTMFSLHRWLLLDNVETPIIDGLENRKLGSYISGTATILFTIGVITGMIIWIPARARAWRQGLRVKTSGSWKRTNHDLHNTLGFYSCILLFLMGITGPQWSFEWYREGLRKTLGTYQRADVKKPEEPKSTIPYAEAKSLPIAELIAIADKELVYKGDYSINFASDSAATISITKNKIGFFASAAGDKLIVDQYSGEVLAKEIFSEKPLNERISGSIKALHIGDIYGMFSKILYFLACLIATSLPVTGILIWINKMKKPVKNAKSSKNLLQEKISAEN